MARGIEILFQGLGGQGIVLASVVLAEALGVHQGLEVVQMSTLRSRDARGVGALRGGGERGVGELYPGALRPDVIVAMSQKAVDHSGDLSAGGC